MLVCDGETCGRIKRFTPEKAWLPVPPHILCSHLLCVCVCVYVHPSVWVLAGGQKDGEG